MIAKGEVQSYGLIERTSTSNHSSTSCVPWVFSFIPWYLSWGGHIDPTTSLKIKREIKKQLCTEKTMWRHGFSSSEKKALQQASASRIGGEWAHVCCLSHPTSGTLWWQVQKTNTLILFCHPVCLIRIDGHFHVWEGSRESQCHDHIWSLASQKSRPAESLKT